MSTQADVTLVKKKFFYQKAIELWEGFCQEHQKLYELTCDEYLYLLESNIDEMEKSLPLKEGLIHNIHQLEESRNALIQEMNQSQLFSEKILRAGDFLHAFKDLEVSSSILEKLHALLIDVIHKIQDQNKKNQIFLNKAMLTIKELKSGFAGKKEFTTYGSDGQTKNVHKY